MRNGILNVYKEKGYTSHDVVAKLRGILGQKKIGHTGTLDPDAEGVLPVCLGKATKLCDMLTDKDKTYEAVLLFGKTTDTQDITGAVLTERDSSFLTEESVSRCIQSFLGEYEQIPPMYSALKVNGKKLYELARAGVTVERKARTVQIYDIEILRMELPRVSMRVRCSKGTYIRTLCHDIGQELGCGACMESLLRTKVSRFSLEDSLRLVQIEQYRDEGRLDEIILPIDTVFQNLPSYAVMEKYTSLAYNGNSLRREFFVQTHSQNSLKNGQMVRIYDGQKHFIGIYCWEEPKKEFRPEKMFFDSEER